LIFPAALGFAVPVMTVLACESDSFSLIASANAALLFSLLLTVSQELLQQQPMV